MSKQHKNTIRLRGVRTATNSFDNKAWLDNTLLKLEKSLKVKAHYHRGFNWGSDEKGGLQLALAICLELYPIEVAKKVYPAFHRAFLALIQEDGFDVTIDLTLFNQQVVEVWL